MKPVVGVVGAGKLGTALAKAAVTAGFDVWMTSRDVGSTKLIAEVMAPGVQVGTMAEVSARAEIILLTVPIHSFQEIPSHSFDGKVVIDATNYWEPVDGPIERYGVDRSKTSALVQAHFSGARVVKGLNQLGYHDVEDGARAPGTPDRLGVAVAGDDGKAKVVAMGFIDQLGFDPVDAGALVHGERLGPGGPAFGALLSAKDLAQKIGLGAVLYTPQG